MTLRRFAPFLIFAALYAVLVYIFIFATPAYAQGMLYPGCSGIDCQFCHVIALVDKLIKYLIYVSVPIAACLFAYAGFLYVTSGGSVSAASQARTIFKDILIGAILALTGFLVVDTVLQSVAAGYFTGPSWSTVNCVSNRVISVAVTEPQNPTGPLTPAPTPGPSLPSTPGVTVDPTQQYTEQEARQALADANIPVNRANACSVGQASGCTSLGGINKDTIEQAINIKDACGCSVMITGGTEAGHATGGLSHSAGYKIDVAPNTQLDNFIKALGQTGVRPGDGALLYGDRHGNTYARESDHWDITVVAKGSPR